MGWANIYLGDRNAPTVTQAPSSTTQWVNDGAGDHQAPVRASDIGLGVKRYTLTGARDGTVTGQNASSRPGVLAIRSITRNAVDVDATAPNSAA
jgi:hypothetical protein